MCELESLLQQFLELARDNPELLFKICPNKKHGNWDVSFTKGGVWWGAAADSPDEELKDVLKAALDYFELVTDEVIQVHKDHLMEAEKGLKQ